MAGELQASREAMDKKRQIIKELSEATGVDARNVEKIMDQLNLDGSLAHREYKVAQVERFNIGVAARRLSEVDLRSVRIATSEVPL